jgi:hypothetical protein
MLAATAVSTGNLPPPKKRRSKYKRRFTPDEIRQIREQRSNGASMKWLAEHWDRDKSMMSEICNGRNYKKAPGPLQFPKMRRLTLTNQDIQLVLETRKANPNVSKKTISKMAHMSYKRVAGILSGAIKPTRTKVAR